MEIHYSWRRKCCVVTVTTVGLQFNVDSSLCGDLPPIFSKPLMGKVWGKGGMERSDVYQKYSQETACARWESHILPGSLCRTVCWVIVVSKMCASGTAWALSRLWLMATGWCLVMDWKEWRHNICLTTEECEILPSQRNVQTSWLRPWSSVLILLASLRAVSVHLYKCRNDTRTLLL